jgi:membrane protein required for colicin V production
MNKPCLCFIYKDLLPLPAMGLLDIILGGLLLYGVVKGLWKGLFVELASLLSLLLGVYIAVKFYGLTGSVIVFALLFIIVVVGIYLLAKVFTKIADFASLGLLNRILGGLFGGLKMVLILSVTLNFFLKINSSNFFTEKETLDKSLFFYPMIKVSNTIFPVLENWFIEFKESK